MPEPSTATVWTVIVGMAAINFGLRFTPLAALSRLDLPAPVMRWLSYIPISVMGALVASEVLRPANRLVGPMENPGILAAGLTMIVFRLTRSFLGSTLAGMASYVALHWLLGL